ncbi:MAG TPA: hypothetical protein PK157_06135 [Bryobacteraceae bacterium]|nr:hypothetical protein [Bryobacteraceae bacterium]
MAGWDVAPPFTRVLVLFRFTGAGTALPSVDKYGWASLGFLGIIFWSPLFPVGFLLILPEAGFSMSGNSKIAKNLFYGELF